MSGLWSGFAAVVLGYQIGSGLILTATASTSLVLAFSQGFGDAVGEGTTLLGITASTEGVVAAIIGLGAFLVVLVAASTYTRNLCRRLWPLAGADFAERKDVVIAVVAFLVLCFLAAVATGTWSYWLSGEQTIEDGGVRLELFYPTALLGIWAYGTLGWVDGTLKARWTNAHGLVAIATALMLFGLQSRRIMIATAILVAFAMVIATRRQALQLLALKLGVMALVLAVFTLGSSGWRDVGDDGPAGLSDRLASAFDAMGDTKSLERLGSRLTYLWFDGIAHDLRETHGTEIDGGALLVANLAAAMPRALFPAKNEVEPASCESAFEGIGGLDTDLPCTPTSEGYLMGGFVGLLLTGLLWGVPLGVADACVERGPGMARVFGLFLFFPFVLVETGAFAVVSGVRLALIGAAFVALLAFLVRLARGERRQHGLARNRARKIG